MIDVFRIIVQGPQHKEYTSSTDTVGPDLSKGVNGTFSHRCTRATEATEAEADGTDKCLYRSSFLVNEKGSVHLSFTQEDVSTERTHLFFISCTWTLHQLIVLYTKFLHTCIVFHFTIIVVLSVSQYFLCRGRYC